MKKNKSRILKLAEEIFFKAMLAGYASDAGNIEKEETLDGYKTLTFEEGEWKVVDRYCVTPFSDSSVGTTTIFYQGKAVWWMAYGGSYPKSVIPFLKESLRQTYQQSVFIGGRGPDRFVDSDENPRFIYLNETKGLVTLNDQSFESFQGKETVIEISSSSSRCIGWHKYWGMSLI